MPYLYCICFVCLSVWCWLNSLTVGDQDVQLSGMRGAVRRIPHHGRSVANPRTRRAAANSQYQSSPGSTLMVLSPSERDRDPMDPIAGVYSVTDRICFFCVNFILSLKTVMQSCPP